MPKNTAKKTPAPKAKAPKVSLSDSAYQALRERVLDLTLPDGSGLDVLKRIRDMQARLPR